MAYPESQRIMPSIVESESWQGEPVLAVTGLSIIPHGTVDVKTDDRSPASQVLAEVLLPVWTELWPQIQTRLKEGFVRYKIPNQLGTEILLGTICRRDTDNDGTPCDFCLSFVFDADPGYPAWDFWIKRTRIVS